MSFLSTFGVQEVHNFEVVKADFAPAASFEPQGKRKLEVAQTVQSFDSNAKKRP